MSSEVVTLNDLKRILKQSGHSPRGYIHTTVPVAYMYGSAPNNIAVTTGSYYYLNSFTGYTATHNTTNGEYFQADTNGFKILREGIYRLALTIHFNSASTTNVYSTKFYNHTTSTQLGIPQYFQDDGRGFASGANEWVGLIGANEIVVPQFCRYIGTSNMRPTIFVYTVTLLHDPNATELYQGGSSSSSEIVDATAIPTANKVSKFDSDAFMNSEDMSNSDIEDFIEDLDLSGSGSSSGGTIPNVDDFTSEEVDEFVNSLDANSIQAIDYIVEQSTSGIWTYRKWNSGISECWGKHSWTITAWNTWGNLYESNNTYINYPTSLFIEEPLIDIQHNATDGAVGAASVEVWTGGTAARTPNINLVRGGTGATNATAYINIFARGKWK